jgi:hypothetical protein
LTTLTPRGIRVATGAWTVAAFAAGSDTGVSGPTALLLSGSALALGVAIIVSVVAGLRQAVDPETKRRVVRAAAPPALCVAATLVAIAFLVPLKVRLFFGGPALQHSGDWIATHFTPAQLATSRPWVGGFRIREFTRYDEELRFVTADCGGVAACGLVFYTGGVPPTRGRESFRPLYGFWWHWRRE